MSLVRIGIKLSEETKNKLRIIGFNKKHTEETKRKMSVWQIGRKLSEMHRKNISLHHADCSGKNNSMWKDGVSFEPYGLEFNEKLKELIRERDKYFCRLCSIKQTEIKLHIYHIDYDKTNNNPTNLISLCINCHMRTNHNRERWDKFLSKLLNSKLEVVNFG